MFGGENLIHETNELDSTRQESWARQNGKVIPRNSSTVSPCLEPLEGSDENHDVVELGHHT